jgi:8-oxo-dGTP pyrophosphatase MutT (NUDIX family)
MDHTETLNETGYWGKRAAGTILYDAKNRKIGLGKRSDAVLEPGTLGTFGGAVDGSDSIEETVANELMEEIGYFYPTKLTALPVFKDDSFEYHNFICRVNPQVWDPLLNYENDEIVWMDLKDLKSIPKDSLHPGMQWLMDQPKFWSTLSAFEARYQYESSGPGV